jgi:hypothetical protein
MSDFTATFARLRSLLEPFAQKLVVKGDRPDVYCLDTPHVERWNKELNFGSVQIRKNYVSFHLFPVYMYPEMLDELSPELRKRMQGKSCFNFKSIDEPQLRELGQLTRTGFERYRKEKFV